MKRISYDWDGLRHSWKLNNTMNMRWREENWGEMGAEKVKQETRTWKVQNHWPKFKLLNFREWKFYILLLSLFFFGIFRLRKGKETENYFCQMQSSLSRKRFYRIKINILLILSFGYPHYRCYHTKHHYGYPFLWHIKADLNANTHPHTHISVYEMFILFGYPFVNKRHRRRPKTK